MNVRVGGITVEVAREFGECGDALQDLSQRLISKLHQHLEMIRHPAEGMDAAGEPV